MTPQAFRKLALSLPEAHEAPHFERTSFRVKKKIFATMMPDGSQAMVLVRPVLRVHDLLAAHPDIFFDYGGWTWKMGALGIRLENAEAKMLRLLVTEAWRHVATPKRAKAGGAKAGQARPTDDPPPRRRRRPGGD